MNDWEAVPTEPNRPQWTVVMIVVALTAGSALYELLWRSGQGHSAAMFLGIPAVLAILLALTPKARTVTGGIMKAITLALLVMAPLLGEGYLCILLAAPLYYLVGAIIGMVVDSYRKDRARFSGVALLLLPMCMEGVAPQLSFDRAQTVEATHIVAASPDAFERGLAAGLEVHTSLPRFLNIGFPRPLAAHGKGLAVGDARTVHFSGAEGDPEGDLTMRVAAGRPGYIRFETVSDTSKLTQWIRWKSSEVEWKPIDANHTQVTWRIRFDRELDPAWYFGPWERFAVTQAAGYLIDAHPGPGR